MIMMDHRKRRKRRAKNKNNPYASTKSIPQILGSLTGIQLCLVILAGSVVVVFGVNLLVASFVVGSMKLDDHNKLVKAAGQPVVDHSNHDNDNNQQTTDEFPCRGWITTETCIPPNAGFLERFWRRTIFAVGITPATLSCDAKVPLDVAGYCDIPGQQGGRIYRQSCPAKPLRPEQQVPYFTCSMAHAFQQYQTLALNYEPEQPIFSQGQEQQNHEKGIVIQVYAKVLPSVYAIVQVLRKDYQCFLPIELWTHSADEENNNSPFLQTNPIFLQLLQDPWITHRINTDTTFVGYMAKPYSIVYSAFEQVLFLDSDNFPLRDPTFLFETQEYNNQGNTALFWHDYWAPSRDEFFIRQGSVLWELLGMDGDTMEAKRIQGEMEMESGQLVIHRKKSERALKVLLYFAKTYQEWFHPIGLVHGDKDLFRLSWHLTNTPFHYVAHAPGVAGYVNHLSDSRDVYRTCGVTMVQYEPGSNAQPLFMHRNAAKLTTRDELVKLWEQSETFTGSNENLHDEYIMGDYYDFERKIPCCYPKVAVRDQYFKLDNLRDTDMERLEDAILSYAREAFDLLEDDKSDTVRGSKT